MWPYLRSNLGQLALSDLRIPGHQFFDIGPMDVALFTFQPWPANYTKHNPWDPKLEDPPQKRGARWVPMGFSFTFLWSLRLNSILFAVRVESSHVSKQRDTLFHAFALLFWAKVVELRTRSIFLFFM